MMGWGNVVGMTGVCWHDTVRREKEDVMTFSFLFLFFSVLPLKERNV